MRTAARAARTRAATWMLAAAAACAAAPAAAQDVELSIRPGLFRGAETTVGVRYSLEASPPPTYSLDPLLPTSFSWNAALDGSAALRPDALAEPLARTAFDVGARVLLRRIGGCPPGAECTDASTGWDYGYLLAGVRGAGEASQRAREVQAALGLSLLYRPSLRATGLWPFVPGAHVDYVFARPLRSAARDSLDLDAGTHRRFDAGLHWHVRLGHAAVPAALTLLRLEAEWLYWKEFGLHTDLVDAGPEAGRHIAAAIGFDTTGLAPYLRDVFVRWSEGEHPTQKEQRRAWLLGLTFATTR